MISAWAKWGVSKAASKQRDDLIVFTKLDLYIIKGWMAANLAHKTPRVKQSDGFQAIDDQVPAFKSQAVKSPVFVFRPAPNSQPH
jgi:hypothetical protein